MAERNHTKIKSLIACPSLSKLDSDPFPFPFRPFVYKRSYTLHLKVSFSVTTPCHRSKKEKEVKPSNMYVPFKMGKITGQGVNARAVAAQLLF
jgi:hypothetical protein